MAQVPKSMKPAAIMGRDIVPETIMTQGQAMVPKAVTKRNKAMAL